MLFQDYLSQNFDDYFNDFKLKNRSSFESKYHSNYLSIQGFEQDYKVRKESLISSIKSKTFRFSNLYPVVIKNKKSPEKQPRLICIPSVQDRFIQMTLIKYMAKYHKNDLAMFKSADFAVEGLGIIKAREKALELRGTKRYVLKTDISSFFDNLDRHLLIQDFQEVLPEDLLYLFDSVVRCDCIVPHDYNKQIKTFIGSKQGKGVRQGMPLSPLIASFYLSELDEWLKTENMKHVRYADDLIFFLDSEEECKSVFHQVEDKLREIKLSLPKIEDNTKTQIIPPYHEVTFLGLNLRYENKQYNWYIPPDVIKNVEETLSLLTNVDQNIKKKLTLSKTINRMNQIIVGYEHCFKDAESKNLKDFQNRIQLAQSNALHLLFKNIGIDFSIVSAQYKSYLIGQAIS